MDDGLANFVIVVIFSIGILMFIYNVIKLMEERGGYDQRSHNNLMKELRRYAEEDRQSDQSSSSDYS